MTMDLSRAHAASRPLDAVHEIVREQLAPAADAIDRDGVYPAAILRRLGQAGLFSRHLAAHGGASGGGIAAAVEGMAAVAEACMSTAFCAWCQDAAGWYLEQSENVSLRARLQGALANGDTFGGTGLSNPMKSLSGIETFKLRGRRVPGGYEVSGVLPWVSNLGDGHLFGTVFEVAGCEDAGDPAHRVMGMFRCGVGGVELRQNAHFVALEGTGTYSVLFRRARIDDADLLADPLGGMVRRIRPGFVLLQTGMGLGLIQACIDLMREADVSHAHTNRFLPRRPDDVAADLASVRAEIARLSQTPVEHAPDYLRAVLAARLRVSELTLDAGQAALLHWGARGYLHGSPVNRRLREGHFVAIITPSIRHLRQELARPPALHAMAAAGGVH